MKFGTTLTEHIAIGVLAATATLTAAIPFAWAGEAKVTEPVGESHNATHAPAQKFNRQGQPLRSMLDRLKPHDGKVSFSPRFSPIGRKVGYNRSAPVELEVSRVQDRINDLAPITTYDVPKASRRDVYIVDGSWMETPQSKTKEFIDEHVLTPVFDEHVIAERQAAWKDLHDFPQLREQLASVKQAADRFKYERFFKRVYDNDLVQRMENARLLVELVDQVDALGDGMHSQALKRVRAFGRAMEADKRFARLRRFVNEVYKPYDLGRVIADLQYLLSQEANTSHPLVQVSTRHRFNQRAHALLEAWDVLRVTADYEGMTPDEPKEVGHVDSVEQLHKKSTDFTEALLTNMSVNNTSAVVSFIGDHQKLTKNVVDYMATIFDEYRAAHLPAADVDNLPEELGFLVGTARLHADWEARGAKLVQPTILPYKTRRTNIPGALSTSLLEQRHAAQIVANDIQSDPAANLFTLTGPNEAGKTTYVRQVGQHYWLAHLGMYLPTAEGKPAEVSKTDNILASLGVTDSSAQDHSHYEAELRRAKSFVQPPADEPSATPYSLAIFDEFANGTDHPEAVKRSGVILRHFGRMGSTTYLTTHKHELAEQIDKGKFPGGYNLGMEVLREGPHVKVTRRVLRGTTAPSLGDVLAERIGVTDENFANELLRGALNRLYDLEDTRLEDYKKAKSKRKAKKRPTAKPAKPTETTPAPSADGQS